MAIFKEKIKITQEELNYYNELLELSFEDLEKYKHDFERLGAKQDDYIGIRTVEFKNGNYITIDLASGMSNYYDNIVLWSKDNQELSVSDCNYDISSFEMFYDEDIYVVEMEII